MQSDRVRGQLLITVLSTGSSKSILFILPTLIEDESTKFRPINIVVVLFVAFVKDLVIRVRDFDIDYFQ
jgi:hypothetical protein